MNGPTTPPPGAAAPVVDTSRTTSDLVKTLGQFVAAITAVAGTIYLVGTLVLLARLWWTRGLSGVSQVSQLSKDVLVSLGLEVLLAPLVIGVGYAIFRALTPNESPATPTDGRRQMRRWGRLWRPRLGVIPLLAIPALGAWVVDAATNYAAFPTLVDIVIGVVIFAIAWLLGVVTVRAWEALGQGYVNEAAREARPLSQEKLAALAEQKWNSMGAVLVVSLLFAAANVPSWVFVAASFPLGHAIVCPDPGLPVGGYLIGEGASRTYLAPYKNHRIVSFPNDHVVRVIVGHKRGELGHPPCPNAPADATTPPDINVHVAAPKLPAPVIRVHVDSDDG